MERKTMAELVLDGLEIEGLGDVHTLFARALELPEWYGRNLDALFDCLTDVGRDVTIRLLHRGELERRLGYRGRALSALLHRAAEENPHVVLLEE